MQEDSQNLESTQYVLRGLLPMNNAKVTFYFSMGSAGWTESFYRAASSIEVVDAPAAALATVRRKCLVPVAQLYARRISSVEPGTRSNYKLYLAKSGGMPTSSTRDGYAVSAAFRVRTVTGVDRLVRMHGCSDGWVQWNENGAENISMPSEAKDFAQHLVSNTWLLKTTAQTANDPAVPRITSVTLVNRILTFTGAFPGVLPGGLVRVTGCKGIRASQLNRVWRVLDSVGSPATSFTTTTGGVLDPNFTYDTNTGRVRLGSGTGYTFEDITSYDEIMQCSVRKIGRPLDSPRGRR